MKTLLLVFALFIVTVGGKAQINAYAAVTAISGTTLSLSNVNQIYHSFKVGEPIILMQMQDSIVGGNTNNNISYGNISMIANAGNYEVATIAGISGLPNSLTITVAPRHIYNFGGASSVQIISFPKFGSPDYVTTAAITALPWNGKIGGVVAMQVRGQLTVAYPISADGAGFRGGKTSSNYEVNCEPNVYASNSSNYAPKGEGIQVNNTGFLYGRSPLASGGGGGSDDNGGGAGGSNHSAGGQGGPGWNCSLTPSGGLGGHALGTYINNSRFFMGGGGGGGQQNNSVGSAGSNGGGIIIIQAKSLTTSCTGTVSISTNGANAVSSGIDGSGGGGAGGSILLNVVTFNALASCPLKVQSNGGNGGNVNDPRAHGGGGGGGQGVVIYPGTQPTTNITTITNVGVGGLNSSSPGATSADNGTGMNNTGVLINNGFVVLPVKLVKFTGKLKDGNVVLEWKTAMEKNNGHFEIERSNQNGSFATIGEVRSIGNSDVPTEYTYTDASPLAGVAFYRLKQVDIDRTAAYSTAVAIHTTTTMTGDALKVYPNPVVDAFTVKLSGETVGVCTVSLFDLSGKPVFRSTVQPNRAMLSVKLNRRLATGLYVIKVQTQQQVMSGKIRIK